MNWQLGLDTRITLLAAALLYEIGGFGVLLAGFVAGQLLR